MIPRKLHFVWFGSDLPPLLEALMCRCHALNPKWQLRLWRETDVEALMTQMGTRLEGRLRQTDLALATKSDLARYHVVAHEGGVYLDTDFLVLRSLEPLHKYSLWGVQQEEGLLGNAAFGAVAGHPVFQQFFDYLRTADFTLPPHLLAGPNVFTPFCVAAVAQDSAAALLPSSSFFPVHYSQKHDLTQWMRCDLSQAYGAHLWAHSWADGAGDGDSALLARIGALLLNPSMRQPPPV